MYGCLCLCLYLIKGTTCVVCCVCISPCSAVCIGDWEVSAEWVGAQGSSSLSGLVIGVLSVSCLPELLLSFSAPRSTSTSLLMRGPLQVH